MCGIAGLVAKAPLSDERFAEFIESSNLMRHRGPNNTGVVRHDNLVLIHHRLSILDLEARSNQPFSSASGRHTMVYNGEVYNFRDIAQQFSFPLRTSSDTEVVIESFERKGRAAIREWNGIFSAAIFDSQSKQLHLCRDRFGVKPLYVYESDEVLAFASEAKVLLDWLPSFSINRSVVEQYLWYGNSTGQDCFVDGLWKVLPASHITLDTQTGTIIDRSEFWSINDVEQIEPSRQAAKEEVKRLLESAVKRQLIADVPVGVLLSGGVDSSSIVAFAAKHYGRPLDTYTVEYDFNIGGKSELEQAAKVASLFNTNHSELRVDSSYVQDIFADLVYQYDEPFADSAAIPMYQLAKECSIDKRVILQGDGGDELFGGYRRYDVMSKFWLWRLLSKGYFAMPQGRWRERMRRVSGVLNQPSRELTIAYYLSEEEPNSHPLNVLDDSFTEGLGNTAWQDDYLRVSRQFGHLDRVQQLIYTDMSILLPNRYFEKVDKATMKCSLEARVPFMDNELAEYALSLPSNLKVRNGIKKYILKEAMKEIVPRTVLFGPKRGFEVPIRTWLREGLYSFARDVFVTHDMGILNSDHLVQLLDTHKAQGYGATSLLWKSLVLGQWLSNYRNKIAQ